MANKKKETPEAEPVELAMTAETPTTYSREELQRAAAFSGRADLLTAIVQDGEKLTLEQAQKRRDDFYKRKVN